MMWLMISLVFVCIVMILLYIAKQSECDNFKQITTAQAKVVAIYKQNATSLAQTIDDLTKEVAEVKERYQAVRHLMPKDGLSVSSEVQG